MDTANIPTSSPPCSSSGFFPPSDPQRARSSVPRMPSPRDPSHGYSALGQGANSSVSLTARGCVACTPPRRHPLPRRRTPAWTCPSSTWTSGHTGRISSSTTTRQEPWGWSTSVPGPHRCSRTRTRASPSGTWTPTPGSSRRRPWTCWCSPLPSCPQRTTSGLPGSSVSRWTRTDSSSRSPSCPTPSSRRRKGSSSRAAIRDPRISRTVSPWVAGPPQRPWDRSSSAIRSYPQQKRRRRM